jgi:hypothetical protein
MALLDVVIDVSDAQGQIDWPRVAAAGIKLAMIKASEGETFKARTFDTNRAGALARRQQGSGLFPIILLLTKMCQGQRKDTSAGRSKNASQGIRSGLRPTLHFNLTDGRAFPA